MPDAGETAPTVVVMVVDDGTEVELVRVDPRRADLALVDGLARLQLVARRYGRVVRVRGVSDELGALLELVGLADVLALESRGQPERGEQLGVEEVVQPRDPPA